MTPDLPDGPEYPALCERCGAREAWPFRVSSTDRSASLRVELRCKACHGEFDQPLPRPRMIEVGAASLEPHKTSKTA